MAKKKVSKVDAGRDPSSYSDSEFRLHIESTELGIGTFAEILHGMRSLMIRATFSLLLDSYEPPDMLELDRNLRDELGQSDLRPLAESYAEFRDLEGVPGTVDWHLTVSPPRRTGEVITRWLQANYDESQFEGWIRSSLSAYDPPIRTVSTGSINVEFVAATVLHLFLPHIDFRVLEVWSEWVVTFVRNRIDQPGPTNRMTALPKAIRDAMRDEGIVEMYIEYRDFRCVIKRRGGV